jgi:hypothetical protein
VWCSLWGTDWIISRAWALKGQRTTDYMTTEGMLNDMFTNGTEGRMSPEQTICSNNFWHDCMPETSHKCSRVVCEFLCTSAIILIRCMFSDPLHINGKVTCGLRIASRRASTSLFWELTIPSHQMTNRRECKNICSLHLSCILHLS